MHGVGVLIFVYLFLVASCYSVNYCGAKMCGYTNAHTFCQFTHMAQSCIAFIDEGLSAQEKAHVLARLNRRRNDVASGKLPGLPSAGNMLKLRWVEELAWEAQLWARQCRPARNPEEHDACRDLYSINVGQCVASVVGESPGLKVESMVDIWFMQNKYYKGNVTHYEPPQDSSKHFYGDFGQMMWARTYMVGCGRSRFMLPMNGRLRTIERFVCNFAPQGPTPHRPLWNPSVPATACPSRSRPCRVYTSLCEYHSEWDQINDIDESMTIEDHVLLNALLELEKNGTVFPGTLDGLYLSYITLINMENTDTVTKAHFNSMQKRDLVERYNIIGDGSIVKVTLPTLETLSDNPQAVLNMTTPMPQKRLQTIGRPKSYNMEELSNTDSSDRTVENHDLTEAIVRRRKDFYYDYHVEAVDENVTLSPERIVLRNEWHERDALEDQTSSMVPKVITTVTEVTFLYESVRNTVKQEDVTGGDPHWINISAKEYNASNGKLTDDYLSDPETVRELQAALDRMELEASTSNSSSTRKIRRQIDEDAEAINDDEVPEDITKLSSDNYTLITDDVDILTTPLPSQDQNDSIDTPPVLNMMLKYMPYLKTYEKEIINRNGMQNSARCICPSVVLMLCVMRA